jgi:hypothetical protein
METWHWKFDRCPRGALKIIYVLEDEGRIVGQYANIPIDMVYKGQTVLGAQPVDVAIQSDYRGPRQIMRLFQTQPPLARNSGIRFGFGFPNEAVYPVGKKVLGYRDIGKVVMMRVYLNPLLLLAKIWGTPKILELFRPVTKRIGRILFARRWRTREKTHTVEKITTFDERFEGFWDRMIDTYPVMVSRDRDYLNWRYTERPDAKYTIFTVLHNDDIQGFVVLSLQQENMLQGLVVDLLAADEKSTETLLKKAMAYFLDKGVDMVSSWAWPGTTLFHVLKKIRFLQKHDAAPLVCMIFDEQNIDEPFVRDPKNWYVTMGDSDGV